MSVSQLIEPVPLLLERRTGVPYAELRKRWGFEDLRPGQVAGLEALLDGRDALIVMPTGAGKSLIYQLASQCFEGLTIVVTPLIALMRDQLQSLERRGIPALGLSSQVTPQENRAVMQQALDKQARLLYVAPERLASRDFQAFLEKAQVDLFVVDEAHCIAQWGHDFRPDYLGLRRAIDTVKRPVVAALTATATEATRIEVVNALGLREPDRIATSFDRPNLFFGVHPVNSSLDKLEFLAALVKAHKGSALVYAGTRKTAEEVAAELQVRLRTQVDCYHAGFPAAQRERMLKRFVTAERVIMVATNAFGMGVDRRELGLVVHHSIPGSLEAYYQEAGRAGRGGQPSQAILLYHPRDRSLQDFFIREAAYKPDDYARLYEAVAGGKQVSLYQHRVGLDHLERMGLVHTDADGSRSALPWSAAVAEQLRRYSEAIQEMRRHLLTQMIAYAESRQCRRASLVGYFGEPLRDRPPACCDACNYP